eukprot:TRINITY_DN28623_c0_g1_i2.p1 TRINITY_DN28623_c0_g1~~TRINITY_DN28623_c0_g1_i2.p1  ORF type:complete len:1033 (-),score=164.30 TRINITY_DN28623_c0_g1_i2:92-3190(-)
MASPTSPQQAFLQGGPPSPVAMTSTARPLRVPLVSGQGAPNPRPAVACYRSPSPFGVVGASDRSPSPDLRGSALGATSSVGTALAGGLISSAGLGVQRASSGNTGAILAGVALPGNGIRGSFQHQTTYRGVTPSPEGQRAVNWFTTDQKRPTASGASGGGERDRSASPDARMPLQSSAGYGSAAGMALPSALRPPATSSRRPASPDMRERAAPRGQLPAPIRPASPDTRERPPTRTAQPLPVPFRMSRGTEQPAAAPRMMQPPSRSRAATPMERSWSPGRWSCGAACRGTTPTPQSAMPRTPSPCRVVTTEARRPSPQPVSRAVQAPVAGTLQASDQGSAVRRVVSVTTVRQSTGPSAQPVFASAQRQVSVSSPMRSTSNVRSSQESTREVLGPNSPLPVSTRASSRQRSEHASPELQQPDSPMPAAMVGAAASSAGHGAAVATVASTAMAAAGPPSPLPPNVELSEGAWLELGGCENSQTKTCKIKKPLGMGSFGAVWEAEQTSGGPALAVKEILCSSQADLLNALFEGHLLRSFAMDEPPSSRVGGARASACLLPSLVGCETMQLGPELWRVRLAMTRLPGQPLDSFLRQKQQDLQHCDFSTPSSVSQRVGEACYLAKELLLQLAPAFEEVIAGLSYHRDVNAHNILVDLADGVTPQYGLVDFGLAVDVLCWHGDGNQELSMPVNRPSRVGQDGASTWHHLDVGGDCRYWPVSAWVQFLLGWTELESNPILRSEYRTRLDMHSLGLTALQVLVEMMPPLPESALAKGLAGDSGDLLRELFGLRTAWEHYWAMASPLHSRLMETFHTGGDWDLLKADCLEDNVHEAMASQLRNIRSSMVRALSACMRCQQHGAAGHGLSADVAAGLLTALLHLVGSGDCSVEAEGIVGPTAVEVPGPVVWQQVRLAVQAPAYESKASAGSARSAKQNSGSERHADLCLSPAWAPVRNNVTLSSSSTTATSGGGSSNPSGLAAPLQKGNGEELMVHLGQLRERVDWLTQEFARLGENRREDGSRGHHGDVLPALISGQPPAG